MEINNVFSPVPFYKNKKYWHSNKWYTYGQKCPIMMTSQNTLPFQLVVDSGVTLSSFTIKKADNDTVIRTVSTSGNYASIPGESYNVIQVKACAISTLPYGNYYYALTLSDGSTYISDIIAIISDMSKCIKITYKNVESLYFSSGHIDFSNDFVFELYLPTTIGKPEYEYEEELTKRLGYKFLESQVVNKVYKFTFPATEQMCDAYRFVRMCDYIRIDTYNPDLSEYDHYNVIYLSSEVEWLDNGDIASIETSFETDSIVQKLQDYSRTQLVNFYNALLSNSDEVLKFDDETIAQYYSNYMQSIDGKMIRQLDAASSISDNTVIAIDENNGIGAAKKILLKPLITSVIGDELRASEVLQNFQAHISNADIHITAQERALLSLFALDENGDVYLKDKRGFYSNSFISAKGKSDGGSSPSGASALYQLVDILPNATNDGVYGAETGKVLMYNGTKWYAGTIDAGLDEKALKTYLDANKYTTTSYVDSKVSEVSTELNNLLQGALNNKVDTAFFARVFGLLDANGNEIAVNDVTTVANSIKAKFGLWTEQYLSAKGKNDNTSGSASALYQLVDILSNDANDGVYGAEAGKVLMYNGTKWYAGTVNTGLDEKALKTYLDANKYTTTSYVDSKVSAVSTKLDNFLEGSDTDGIINKWRELEAFLAGQTQTSTLAELLAVKADKSIKIIAGTGLTGGGGLSSNVTLSLASSGVTAGTYTKVTVDTYGRVTTGTTLSSSDIPNIGISQVNGLQTALNNKVDNAFFARVFGLLDANGNEIAVNDVTTVANSIKAKFGLWTEQYISALGKNPSSSGGGGGASALYQLVDILPNATNDGVLNAANGSVLMYNGSKWQAGNVVTDISPLTLNVNGSSLFTYDGKSSITANLTIPTKLSQLTDDVVSGKYLPLTAGSANALTGNLFSTKSIVFNYNNGDSQMQVSPGTFSTGKNYFIQHLIRSNNSTAIANLAIYNSTEGEIEIRRKETATDGSVYANFLWLGLEGMSIGRQINTCRALNVPNTFEVAGLNFLIGSAESSWTSIQGAYFNWNKTDSKLTLNKAYYSSGYAYTDINFNVQGTITSSSTLSAPQFSAQSEGIYTNYRLYLPESSCNPSTITRPRFGRFDRAAGSAVLQLGTSNLFDIVDAAWSTTPLLRVSSSAFTYKGTAVSLNGHTHSYLPLSGGTMTGNILAKDVQGVDNSNRLIFRHLDGQNCNGDYNLYLQYFQQSSVIYLNGSTYKIYNKGAEYNGNAATATALTTSAGSATLPIYFSSGKPVACTASSVFSNLSNSGNSLSITVAGQNRTLTINYASNAGNADKLDGYHLTSTSSSYVNPWNTVPVIKSDGVMEIGRYLDFHFDNTSNLDYSCRLQTDSNSQNVVRLPSASGTLALVEGSVAYATSAGNADTLDGLHYTSFLRNFYTEKDLNELTESGVYRLSRINANNPYAYSQLLVLHGGGDTIGQLVMSYSSSGRMQVRSGHPSQVGGTGSWGAWNTVAFTTDNVASATKLQTARTIWGQSFDGTTNVSGTLTNVYNIIADGVIYSNKYNSSGNSSVAAFVFNKGDDLFGIGPSSGWVTNVGFGLTTDTNGTWKRELMTITNSGNVGIGTAYPSEKLHVVGNIIATGAITAKASSSDIRLKTDISDYKALSIIRGHKSIKYHWNEAAKANADIFNDNDWHFGLIAQELQQDLPQMVSDVFKDYLVIQYERLIPIMWRGIQEVDDEVTRLKKKVRKMEMEIRELKQERI